MQVEVDLKRMQTNFGGCDLFGFGDFAHFSFAFKTAMGAFVSYSVYYRLSTE